MIYVTAKGDYSLSMTTHARGSRFVPRLKP
uniref:Uncharacterized protein n=1 Tax=Anguilla anguilla TaxID=7936 RepID=A0A0E9XI18_ANGAN